MPAAMLVVGTGRRGDGRRSQPLLLFAGRMVGVAGPPLLPLPDEVCPAASLSVRSVLLLPLPGEVLSVIVENAVAGQGMGPRGPTAGGRLVAARCWEWRW